MFRQNERAHSLLLCANTRLTSPCVSILWDDLECMELPLEWDDVVASVALRGNRQLCILYRYGEAFLMAARYSMAYQGLWLQRPYI